VVVQSDDFLPSSVVLVAPTSRSAPSRSYRPAIDVDGSITRVLVEQLTALDVSRLGDHRGHVTREELWDIEQSLALILDLR
jgi:mRNA interferase MazF